MSKTKRTKPSKISAKKKASPSAKKPAKKKLSTLEKELLEYAKKGQPVLLYGKDTSRGRVNLINRIHLLNGGIDASWEYPGYEGNDKSSVVIHDAMTKALKEQDTEKAKSFLDNCEVTHKTWRRVDCEFKGGEEVFNILYNKFELFSDGFGGRGLLLMTEEKIKIRKLYKQHMESLSQWKKYLFCHGLLFVDRLKCTRNDPKDEEWYLKLAQSIESIKTRDHISGDWLVAYAYDTKTFPQYFLDQFKMVPLDGKKAVMSEVGLEGNSKAKKEEQEIISVETALSYNKTTGRFRFGGMESIAISKTSRTKARDIARKLMKCWEKGKPCTQSEIVQPLKYPLPQWAYDNISKIRKALEGIGVNMPQSTNEEYPLPEEPESFKIVS